MIKNLIFDFDGVILDSMPVRDVGFREIFKEHGKEPIEKFLPYHREKGGISRFVKIRYFYEELLGLDISEEKVQELAQLFTKIMREELTDPKYLIHETVDFIRENQQAYRMHVASGSEEGELKFLCETHGITDSFQSIHGSPTPKPKLIADILQDNRYDIIETVMIGDSTTDYESAIANGIDFYGYNNPKLKELSDHYIESFRGFSFASHA